MARNVSDEEIQLRKRARRRLVGAVVLVAVVSALLPMVLDREPGQSRQEIAIQVPPREGAPPLRAPEQAKPPAPEVPPAAPAPAVEPAPAKPADAPAKVGEPKQPAPAENAAKAPDKPAVAPEPKSAEKGTPAAATNEQRFVVQLGAFSDPANAKQLSDRLSAEGIKSYTEVLKGDRGEKLRVRAGPYPTREAADQANERLRKLGVKGIVAPL